MALTSYLSISRRGRRLLVRKFHEHTLLCCCAMLSFCVLPFAPLGIDNAVTGVCFFCMYWMLILMNGLFPDGLHHETGAEGEGTEIKPSEL